MPFDHIPRCAYTAVQAWMSQHAEGITNAARLLGGPAAEQGVLRLADELQRTGRFSRLARTRFTALHQLLSLNHDNDAPLPLDPADPRVLEICLLADSLGDLLLKIGEPRQLGI